MEKDRRNAIERATQKARRLLEDDFAAQLESTFDVLLAGILAPAPGAHLSDREAKQRETIVGAIDHKRAFGMTAGDAVVDYVRDAAFTTLNRLAALKMLEARGLLQECVSKGEQSSGYREFCGLAPGNALLPDGLGYRLYVESLFDELSTEIKVLFDRRDPAAVLWPRRATFAALLEAFNAPDLTGVWSDDETIGWVYQYFNSADERRKMREASQAPRNSRELAVRNQFFTPRYVVEFLVDNTLGRTWIEMQSRNSGLAEKCRYLVRTEDDAVRRRPKKDPRDLRVLDPACGSGHFLLYAFDLLLIMYEEAWAAEGAPCSDATGRTLRDDYPDLEALQRAAPALIVEHNLHGVDIDPRAAQIAALALWLRAQRAWQALGVPAPRRPRISRTHIVVAEPMPGDKGLVEDFSARLNPPLLRDLFREMVTGMRLAGELGTLLPVDESLAAEVTRARAQFAKQRDGRSESFLPGLERQPDQGNLDLSGIDDDGFFQEAETRLIGALHEFAEGAAGGASVRRRLFAGDSTQGIALIDLMRRRFDVVLMNPPFGDSTPTTRGALAEHYPKARLELYACFLDAALRLSASGARIGILSSRLGFFLGSLEDWRGRCLLGSTGTLELLADLGHNVLDGALVEAAAYVVQHEPIASFSTWACSFLNAEDKRSALLCAAAEPKSAVRPGLLSLANDLPGRPIPYWLPSGVIDHLVNDARLPSIGSQALVGIQTDDDFRFVRLAWEGVSHQKNSSGWRPFAKGGEYSPYYDDIHLAIRWHEAGHELRAFIEQRNSWTKRASSVGRYGEAGLTYPERTTSEFSPRPLPEGTVFSIAGPAILSTRPEDTWALLCLYYTRWYRILIEAYVGGGDAVQAGSAARHYKTGMVNNLPLPTVEADDWNRLAELGEGCALSRAREFSLDETSRLYTGFPPFNESWRTYCHKIATTLEEGFVQRESASKEAESICRRVFSLDDEAWRRIDGDYGPHTSAFRDGCTRPVLPLLETDYSELCGQLVATRGFSRQTSKLSHWTHKVYETVAHLETSSVGGVVQTRRSEGRAPRWIESEVASSLISHWVGVAFGRWRHWSVSAEITPEHLLRPPARPFAEVDSGEGQSCTLVDDEGHKADLVARITELCPTQVGVQEIVTAAGARESSLRSYLRTRFFDLHLSRHSKSRRRAPVYWQLSTPSGAYSVWLYAHRVTRDTFFQIQNDIVGPKLQHEEQRLTRLIERAGELPSAAARKEIAGQESLVEELRAMLQEIRRVAPLWNPELADGTVLVMAPLWRLVPQHKAWQQDLKSKWDELVAGGYDWACIAMHLWPERVAPKCASDRSLAIAHGLENVLWICDFDDAWRPLRQPSDERFGVQAHWQASPRLKLVDLARDLWESRYRAQARGDSTWFADAESGLHDDHPLALRLWTRRVCERSLVDETVAAAHNISRPRLMGEMAGASEAREAWLRQCERRYGACGEDRSFAENMFRSTHDERSWRDWWRALEKGEADHLPVARYVRPAEVAARSHQDHAFAVLHGVDRFFFVNTGKGFRQRLAPKDEMSREVRERTSPAVKAALKSLLGAPVPGGNSRRAGAARRGARV